MSTWIQRAVARGRLTTRFPWAPPNEEEAPITAHAPEVPPPATRTLPLAAPVCPTGAIESEGVRQGACIRCARCLSHGLTPTGPVDLMASSIALLRSPSGLRHEPPSVRSPSPGFRRSLHVFLIDVGSCNACNREALGLANPYYDSQRLGIFFTNSPRHADVLLVVGIPTREMLPSLSRTYEAMPGPKAVVAIGACALEGGIFHGNPHAALPLSDHVPVDAYVPGCPPPPLAILSALWRVMRGPPSREGP